MQVPVNGPINGSLQQLGKDPVPYNPKEDKAGENSYIFGCQN